MVRSNGGNNRVADTGGGDAVSAERIVAEFMGDQPVSIPGDALCTGTKQQLVPFGQSTDAVVQFQIKQGIPQLVSACSINFLCCKNIKECFISRYWHNQRRLR